MLYSYVLIACHRIQVLFTPKQHLPFSVHLTIMKRLICLPLFLLLVSVCFAQFSKGQLDAYATPGLFNVKFSHDGTVPERQQGRSRLGSLGCYGIQYGVSVSKRIMLKAGVGYTSRKYSMVKYAGDPFFIFYFFSDQSSDPFPISRIQYNNSYIEAPLAFEYNPSVLKSDLQVHFGFNARLQFLAKAKVTITPDDSQPANTSPDAIRATETYYVDDVNSFVITLEPYMDIWIRLHKGLGIYYRIKPVSFYASRLNQKTTTSQIEFIGGGVGLSYHF